MSQEEKLKADRRAEHVPLSVEDPDDLSPSLSQVQYGKQVMLNNNIYNAYILSKYKPSEQAKWHQAAWFTRFYISILPYFIAVIQWAAVIILSWVQFVSYEGREDNVDEFGLYWDEYWAPKLLMWPFWFIALCYTYAHHLEYEIDVWSLRNDRVVAMDLSQTGCKCNFELLFLKHLTEGVLNQWGGLVFYCIVAACSDYAGLGDFINLIYAMLGYMFIFDLDEYAFTLVKDIFIFTFNDKSSSQDPNTPFYGQQVFTLDGTKQAPLRLLAVFFASISIQGIFMRSYLIFGGGGICWAITEGIKLFIGGHQRNLCIKTRNE
mmetsp:Transcript_56863/g.51168  ORF Transcript_56863/g.51168 Transcript_56863/m.51168 type:complete len:320 (+) Transcript_56863:28-987(+)